MSMMQNMPQSQLYICEMQQHKGSKSGLIILPLFIVHSHVLSPRYFVQGLQSRFVLLPQSSTFVSKGSLASCALPAHTTVFPAVCP